MGRQPRPEGPGHLSAAACSRTSPLAQNRDMSRYNVVSIDNAHLGLSGEQLDRGEFESADAAVGRAKELVDKALSQLGEASSADELMAQYMRRGSEMPMIYGEPRAAFHAYQYAREKANAIFAS